MSTLPTVLIVEDEFLIALGAADLVQSAGYTSVEVSNADDAVSVLEDRTDIGIVFTDIRMPRTMDGLELAHCIRKRWPPIKIIVTSGHHVIQSGDLPDGGVFIPKPYTDREVTEVLHALTA
jgi:two-component system, response regulator PdtaR